MKVNVSVIEKAINSQPCRFCGKQHSVKLDVNDNDLRPVLMYSFSDGACEEFKDEVKRFVAKQYLDAGFPVTML